MHSNTNPYKFRPDGAEVFEYLESTLHYCISQSRSVEESRPMPRDYTIIIYHIIPIALAISYNHILVIIQHLYYYMIITLFIIL